ncbi:MAG: restriction endonuclease subunit S [Candidatus Kapabacteria bacterium]|nr:restriction endonuclease subunit S [Candidatus Kapabacteria bacterium]
MKKYDSYKDSGIEWIGEIPNHWKEMRMRFLGYLYGGLSGKTASDFDQSSIERNKYFIPFTNIANNFKIDPHSLQTVVISENENQNKVEVGDLFFLMSSENYEDVGKSAVLLDDLPDTYLNTFCKGFRITNENVIPRFLNYQLHSRVLRHNLLTGANGFTRINLKIDKVIDLFTALPPLKEQKSIANYLDRKTAEIDELITAKKRLLELYEEEKTAVINQAVTKGINPDVPMKDSGIEWLGKIPKHWEVKRLKTIARVQTGRTPKIQNSQIDYFENGELNWFTPSDFDGNIELIESKRKLISEAIEIGEVELFPECSIYLVSIGATLGKVSFFRDKASANQQINIIIFHQTYNPLFGYYFLVGNKEMINLEADYTTLPILNQSKTKSLLFAVPPPEEQQLIVKHIEIECARIDNKNAKTEKLIELLTEYRTALISEVVTGKVKVIE